MCCGGPECHLPRLRDNSSVTMPQNARERRHDGLIILNYPEFNVCIPVHNRRFWTMSDHITGVFDELLQRQHLHPAFVGINVREAPYKVTTNGTPSIKS